MRSLWKLILNFIVLVNKRNQWVTLEGLVSNYKNIEADYDDRMNAKGITFYHFNNKDLSNSSIILCILFFASHNKN